MIVEGIRDIADPDGDVAVFHDITEVGAIDRHRLRELEQDVVVAIHVVDGVLVAAAVAFAGIGHSQSAAVLAEVPRRPASAGGAAEGAGLHRNPVHREGADVARAAAGIRAAGEADRRFDARSRRLVDARVPSRIVLAVHQGGAGGHARRRVGIAVVRIRGAARRGWAEHVARRQAAELHIVVARRHREVVETATRGGRGRHEGVVALVEVDLHPVDARFTRILDAVGIQVVPNLVPDRRQRNFRQANAEDFQLEPVVGRGVGGGGGDHQDISGNLARVEFRGARAGQFRVVVLFQTESGQERVAQRLMVVVGVRNVSDPRGEIAVFHDVTERGARHGDFLREFKQDVVEATDVIDGMLVVAAVSFAGIRDAQAAAILAEVGRRPSAGRVAAEGGRLHRDTVGGESADIARAAAGVRSAREGERPLDARLFGLDEPRVPRRIMFARLEGRAGHGSGARVGVAIRGVRALILRGEHIPGRQNHQDIVIARCQPREGIQAVAIGGGGSQDVPRAIQQTHRHSAHARFAKVLLAIGIGVFPDEVADAGRLVEAGIPSVIVLARHQGGAGHLARDRIRIAVGRIGGAARYGRARRVTGRSQHFDLVVARHQTAEAVEAIRVRHRAVEHVARAIQQLHRHARDAGFAEVLHAIRVLVFPHEVADAGRLVEARVPRIVVFAWNQRGAGHLARDRVGIAVRRIGGATRHGRARRVTGRSQHFDLVVARHQTAEAVEAIRVRHRAVEHVARAIQQLHRHARDAGFAEVLHAIRVLVFPHEVADAGRLVEARVPRIVVFAWNQRGAGHFAGDRVGIAVGRIGNQADHRGARQVTGRSQHLDLVVAREQAAEPIQTVGIGRGAVEHVAIAIQQLYRHTWDAGFAEVLLAIGIRVFPHEIADAGQFVEAGVPRIVVFAAHQRRAGHFARHGIRVAIGRIGGRIGDRRARQVTGGCQHLDLVVARHQARESIQAVGVGRGAIQHIAAAIQQLHRDARDAGFAEVLHAVGIRILPHEIAD